MADALSVASVRIPPTLAATAHGQAGVVSHQQARAAGISDSAMHHAVSTARWRRVHPRVYVLHSGPLSRAGERWAAVLYAGAGAHLSHQSAASVHGWMEAGPCVHVTVPLGRRARPRAGIAVHRRQLVVRDVTTKGGLPVTTARRTAIDLLDSATTVGDAITIVARAVQTGVDANALRRDVGSAARIRWKGPVLESLSDIASGSHSYLELRFAKLLRRHGLPLGERQAPFGRTRTDMAYDGVVIELDGRLGHADAVGRLRDMHRDNAHSLAGRTVLRFGWHDVAGRPCDVAAQVAAALGVSAKLCAPSCTAGRI